MLVGAFVADALALGPHWVYDSSEIETKLGKVEGFHAPLTSYHPGKAAGDYTHLGDQMWTLQQSVLACGGLFDAQDFSRRWREIWTNSRTQSYRDKASEQTLQNLERGTPIHEAGSLSEELAGPVRGIPVLVAGLRRGASEQQLIEGMQEQTALTHRGIPALHTAAFIARLALGLAAGLDLETALDGGLCDSSQIVRDHGLRAESSKLDGLSTAEAIKNLGQACNLNQALPSAIILLVRHGGSYREAMIENVMAGGDSAARGILVGALLGYVHGLESIPKEWREALHTLPV